MSRTLAAAVYLPDPEGRTHVFGPGSTLPDWAAEKITNPNAWSVGEASPEPAPQEPIPEDLQDEPGDPEAELPPAVSHPQPPKRGGRR